MARPAFVPVIGRPSIYERLNQLFKAHAPAWALRTGRALLSVPKQIQKRRELERRLRRLPPQKRALFASLYREADERWWRHEIGPTGDEVVFPIPGEAYTLSLRPGTSDILVYAEVILGTQYAVPVPWPVHTIVDAGANVGITSAYFLSRYPDAISIAIEPDPVNFELCQRNLAQFGKRAVVVRAALTPVPGRVSLVPEFQGSWAAQVVPAGGGNIEALDIDTLRMRFNLDTIDLLKVDIEGSERALFEYSRRDWIDNIGAFMVELESDASEVAFYAALDNQKFRFVRSGEITAAIRPGWSTRSSALRPAELCETAGFVAPNLSPAK
jgi:FkbM family methyltransferase